MVPIINILVVEDDVPIAQVIKGNIERLNHRAETAGTGQDALKKVRKKRFDLVLLDLFLPDCEGHELIPQFKEVWSDIGIVTMTGYNSRELEWQVRKQGILFYMIKPFSMKVLKEILDHILKKKRKEVKREWLN